MNERSFIIDIFMNKESTDKRILILNATEKLLAQEGFHGLSMQKVAKEAGVAAGTIYRYFRDKEHLIEQTRLHVTQRLADFIQADIRDDMTIKEQFTTIWMNIWNFASTDDAGKSHQLYESIRLENEEQIQKQEHQMFGKIDQMFEQGKAQGPFKPLDNRLLSAVSLETSATIARKKRNRCYQIDEENLKQAIEASWDAIIQH